MTKEAVELIARYGEESNPEIHKDYCRREQEKSSYGISFSSDKDFFEAIACIMMIEDEAEREIVGDALQKIMIDNLGKGFIYY